MEQTMDLDQLRADYLQEVIGRFNSKNRAQDPGGKKCTYSGGCAVGYRLIAIGEIELCEKLDGYLKSGVKHVFTLLPDKIRLYGIDFLTDLQSLHDIPDNWIETGLSGGGRSAAQSMIERYNLPMQLA